MVTSSACFKKYGSPADDITTVANELLQFNQKWMIRWGVPLDIRKAIPALPSVIYLNRDLAVPLEAAFRNLIANGVADEFKTFDGCYNVRPKKGNSNWSLHSWGIAIDCNAAWNGWRKKPTLSAAFVKAFKDAGFHWGGDWKTTPDGMHFQLAKI